MAAGAIFQALIFGDAGAGSPSFTLTYRGHGEKIHSPNAAATLSYGTVSGGSAPIAGNLVIWVNEYIRTVGSAVTPTDLTGSGWTQSSLAPNASNYTTFLAKVIVAGDISSPPSIGTLQNNSAGLGYWVAYTISGSLTTLSWNSHTTSNGGTSAPTSRTVDSSAIGSNKVAITVAAKSGDDDSPSTPGGVTWDYSNTENNIGTASWDIWLGSREDIGGANYTVTGADDGGLNALTAAYLLLE